MSQTGKLQTITPTLRSAAPVVSSSPPSPSTDPFSITTDRPSIEPGDSPISISFDKTARTSVAFFSIQNLIAMMPGWSVSLFGHGAVIVLLALIATAPIQDASIVRLDALMVDSGNVPELDEMLNEIDLSDSNVLNIDVSALNSEASRNTADVIHDDGLEVSLLEGMSDGIGTEALAQTGLTPVDSGSQGGLEKTEGTSAEFFGTNATGSRFIFIIDASASMNEGIRWQQALNELESSISKLGEKQQALILLYNFQTFPMFDTAEKDIKLLPVTDEFKSSLSRWLSNQIPFGGTRPAHALQFSLSLKPDAIFLLSDGLIVDNSIRVLARNNVARTSKNRKVKKIPINTVSLGPHVEGAEIMKLIAEKNDGEFTWVQ